MRALAAGLVLALVLALVLVVALGQLATTAGSSSPGTHHGVTIRSDSGGSNRARLPE